MGINLINSEDAVRSQLSSEAVAGKLSDMVHELGKDVNALRVFIEGSIDFSDEDYDFIAAGNIEERLIKIKSSLTDLIDYLFIFTVVSNPFIGLEQTQYSSFDIIICQECPYGLDAYEFTRILRNLGEFTPIVVLTNDDEMLQWNKEIKKRIPTTPHGERGERPLQRAHPDGGERARHR